MTRTRRRQFMTDEAVQGELLFRAMVYWFFCLMTVSLLVLGWSMFTGPPRPFGIVVRESMLRCAPAILGSVALLPLVLLDVLKVSNRFVGPVEQVRHGLRCMADGEPTPQIALRKDDFWQELAFYFNKVAASSAPQKDLNEAAETSNVDEPVEHAEV